MWVASHVTSSSKKNSFHYKCNIYSMWKLYKVQEYKKKGTSNKYSKNKTCKHFVYFFLDFGGYYIDRHDYSVYSILYFST